MFTPSLFHFSMKLSTCACAAVVSVPVMLRMAVEPVLTLAFFERGHDHVVDAALVVLVTDHGDRLALELAGARPSG